MVPPAAAFATTAGWLPLDAGTRTVAKLCISHPPIPTVVACHDGLSSTSVVKLRLLQRIQMLAVDGIGVAQRDVWFDVSPFGTSIDVGHACSTGAGPAVGGGPVPGGLTASPLSAWTRVPGHRRLSCRGPRGAPLRRQEAEAPRWVAALPLAAAFRGPFPTWSPLLEIGHPPQATQATQKCNGGKSTNDVSKETGGRTAGEERNGTQIQRSGREQPGPTQR